MTISEFYENPNYICPTVAGLWIAFLVTICSIGSYNKYQDKEIEKWEYERIGHWIKYYPEQKNILRPMTVLAFEDSKISRKEYNAIWRKHDELELDEVMSGRIQSRVQLREEVEKCK